MVEETYNNSDTELKQDSNQKKIKLKKPVEKVKLEVGFGNILNLTIKIEITKQTEQKVNPCRLLELKDYIRILEANLAEKVDQNSKKDSQQLSKIMLTNNE
ncbi:9375_t:CDS:2 [Funneliformis geosporum]|uniref:9375_t:CDS:1 n=1 Tax=Funneliformis geosporum TaxID=1117311 RepID=A0A9W4SXU8_9GLOM|nr:9375_t:CDS:2 [Funneliformis geosporum]